MPFIRNDAMRARVSLSCPHVSEPGPVNESGRDVHDAQDFSSASAAADRHCDPARRVPGTRLAAGTATGPGGGRSGRRTTAHDTGNTRWPTGGHAGNADRRYAGADHLRRARRRGGRPPPLQGCLQRLRHRAGNRLLCHRRPHHHRGRRLPAGQRRPDLRSRGGCRAVDRRADYRRQRRRGCRDPHSSPQRSRERRTGGHDRYCHHCRQ